MVKQFTRSTFWKKVIFTALLFEVSIANCETVGVFSDPTVAQIKFAASDVKLALESKGLTVEMLPLTSLTTTYANKKVIISLASNSAVTTALAAQSGTLPTRLGEQAYALRTTSAPQASHWALGGDANGTMYGGLQIAENIKFYGFETVKNAEESPSILKRGIKLNLPFDLALPTFGTANGGDFSSSSSGEAIPHVWDYSFWTTWFDEMARNRFNVLSVWNPHFFPALVKLQDYPNVAINNVKGINGFSITMTINEKIEFWKKVMAHAHARGFEFYFFTWNVHTNGATNKYGITENANNSTTKDYMYKSVKALLETYPDLDGLGVTNGENNSTELYLWDTYGKAIYDYAVENPNRNLKFIHRWHQTTLPSIKSQFAPLFSIKNVSFAMSYKYSNAHMYSSPRPRGFFEESIDVQLRKSEMKTWLTVRNDEFYYSLWGDPDFAREYVKGMIDLGEDIFSGFYIGSDGFNPTRTFFSKYSVHQGMMDISRQWYMNLLWGRISYNPKTSDDVFIKYMEAKYPTFSSSNLFKAWNEASRSLPKITEIVHSTWSLDYKWWIEFNLGRLSWSSSEDQWRTIERWADADPAIGSLSCGIGNSASGNCGTKKTSLQLADEIEKDAKSAINIGSSVKAVPNTELGIALNNIKAMAFLSMYYGNKIRAATYYKMGSSQASNKTTALEKAFCWWKEYASTMDLMYKPMNMSRVRNFSSWQDNDADVLAEFRRHGGVGTPTCDVTVSTLQNANESEGIEIHSISSYAVFARLQTNSEYSMNIYTLQGKKIIEAKGVSSKTGITKITYGNLPLNGVYIIELKLKGFSTSVHAKFAL